MSIEWELDRENDCACVPERDWISEKKMRDKEWVRINEWGGMWEKRNLLLRYFYYCICYCDWPIGIMVRVFANGPRHWGSILCQVIPKTQKIVLDASLLNTQHYKIWIKGKGVVPFFPPWCSNYWKESLWVALNYSWSTYLLLYFYYCICYCIVFMLICFFYITLHWKWNQWPKFQSWMRLFANYFALILLGKARIHLYSPLSAMGK